MQEAARLGVYERRARRQAEEQELILSSDSEPVGIACLALPFYGKP